jgi:hypothetical protein
MVLKQYHSTVSMQPLAFGTSLAVTNASSATLKGGAEIIK